MPLEKELKINGLIFAIPSAAASAVPLYYYLYPRFQGADFLMFEYYLPWEVSKTGAAGYGILHARVFLSCPVYYDVQVFKGCIFFKTCSIVFKNTDGVLYFSAAGLYITAVYPPTGTNRITLLSREALRLILTRFKTTMKIRILTGFYPRFLNMKTYTTRPVKTAAEFIPFTA